MREEILIQFDSLSSDYDSLIDECFKQWCEDNEADYWNFEDDFPIEFKSWFVLNEL